MSETTLTYVNLLNIYRAMVKIHHLDQSTFFKQYLKEIQDRLIETDYIKDLIKQNDRNK